MIIPLKRKYTTHKPVRRTKASGDHNQKAQKKKGKTPKTYEYGSRVMLMADAYRGATRMVDGDPKDYKRGLVK